MRPPSTRTNLLRFYTVDDLRTLPPARWLIEQMLEQPAVGSEVLVVVRVDRVPTELSL